MKSVKSLGKKDGEGRNRTADAGIFSPSLYQLSYLAGNSGCRLNVGHSHHLKLQREPGTFDQ